jgi:2-hydroxychromene-2-carboxylate isomerase
MLSEFELAPTDRAAMADSDLRRAWHASLPEALRQGVWGWVDDDLAHIRPWGFDVEEIWVPVEIR